MNYLYGIELRKSFLCNQLFFLKKNSGYPKGRDYYQNVLTGLTFKIGIEF